MRVPLSIRKSQTAKEAENEAPASRLTVRLERIATPIVQGLSASLG